MARMGGERKEGWVMEKHKRKCWDCGNIAIHEDRITPWVLCKHCGSQDTRPTKPQPPSREQKLETTVAELVGLLRMGHDLREEAFEQGLHTQGVPRKAEAARLEVVRILALYDAAITKHGGAT